MRALGAWQTCMVGRQRIQLEHVKYQHDVTAISAPRPLGKARHLQRLSVQSHTSHSLD